MKRSETHKLLSRKSARFWDEYDNLVSDLKAMKRNNVKKVNQTVDGLSAAVDGKEETADDSKNDKK